MAAEVWRRVDLYERQKWYKRRVVFGFVLVTLAIGITFLLFWVFR